MLEKIYLLLEKMQQEIGNECTVSVRCKKYGLEFEAMWMMGARTLLFKRHYSLEYLIKGPVKRISHHFIQTAKQFYLDHEQPLP